MTTFPETRLRPDPQPSPAGRVSNDEGSSHLRRACGLIRGTQMGDTTTASRLAAMRETYRTAEFRLRQLLFGDSIGSAGRLRGEEPRRQAVNELRRMRTAFDDAAGEAESSHGKAVDEDLHDAAAAAAREGIDSARETERPQ
jgi:hypothetical protein